ncbi:MAG: tetratricopeptide repeat protein [Anaerolineae bacterium]|nr:tetratricopeptide repeat protein [Anaerolineae bacterium]
MKTRVLPILFGYCVLAGGLLFSLAACATPEPTLSPLRLPTRIPFTPTPTPTPISVATYVAEGVAYRAAGDTLAALEVFSHTLVLDPAFVPAYLERGKLYRLAGDSAAALADVQQALVVDPTYAPAYVLMGEILRLDFGDLDQALEAYDRAVALDPTLAAATFPARWEAAEGLGRGQAMLALVNEHGQTTPEDPLLPYYRARALDAMGAHGRATQTLIEAIETGNGSAVVWFTLGEIYVADHAWEYAHDCFEQASALIRGGDNSLALVSDAALSDLFAALGEAYIYTDRCIDAQAMLSHALAVGPDRPELHTLVGQAIICQTPTPTPTPYPW